MYFSCIRLSEGLFPCELQVSQEIWDTFYLSIYKKTFVSPQESCTETKVSLPRNVILVNKTGRIGASVSILLAEKAASYSPLRDIQFCYYTVCATTRECYCYLIFYPAGHSNFLTSRLALWPPNPRELVIASPTWPGLATLGT